MNSEIKVIDKLNSMLTVDDLATICAEDGVTVRSVCKTLSEGLKSTIMRIHNNGVEDSKEADNPTRHKYMTSAMELLRMTRKEASVVVGKVEHSMAPEDISRMEIIIKEMIKLEEIRNNSAMQRGEIIDVRSVPVI